MRIKVLFFSIVIVLFFSVLFLDQNSEPVPVKIILGEPRPIGLSTVILSSMLLGAVLSAVAMLGFNAIRKPKKNLQISEQ
ncbi:MAG TPA: LapA family protein [Desulfuromonadales bacterium]|nr:LapA family protein [Desulfuromonadales bacterium]